jgi:type I restriction enzyme S subunit
MCVLDFEGYVAQVQTGTSIPHISGQQIFDFPIVVPERKVVEKFDHFISKIVKHDFNVNAENQQLENFKNLLLSKLSTIEN